MDHSMMRTVRHGDMTRRQHHHWNEDELQGETRFPTAVSYASDAQRSDAATVCSESVVDEDDAFLTSQEATMAPPSPNVDRDDPMVSSSGGDTTPTAEDDEEEDRCGSLHDADCESSLDVEANSAGMRSIHSQEDLQSVVEQELMSTSPPLAEHTTTSRTASGRQSPGGTIYKGRGKRRYEGRYMHLPLKRFHHDSSAPHNH